MFNRIANRLLVFVISTSCGLLGASFFGGQGVLLNESAQFVAIEAPRAPAPDGSEISIRYIGLGPCLSLDSRVFEIVNDGNQSVYFDAIRNRHAYWAVDDLRQSSTTLIFRDAKTHLMLLPGSRAQLTLDMPKHTKRLEISFFYLIGKETLSLHRSAPLEGGNDVACG